MRCKEPNKLRMEGRIGLYIVNDTTRYFRIPQLHLTRRENIATVPAKHYSLLDIGLLTQCSLKHMTSRFLRTETLDDKTTHVFSFQPNDDRSSRYTAWIDPQTHAILKREWYDAAGKLRATFVYRNIQEVAPGIWVPSRIEILNGTGTVAAITEYRNLRVNQGIADSVFEIE
jgi:outer membrane lipoprotein-sorting protein